MAELQYGVYETADAVVRKTIHRSLTVRLVQDVPNDLLPSSCRPADPPPGFRRVRSHYSRSADGLTLKWVTEDEEIEGRPTSLPAAA